jgi:hypothetical protein
MVGLIDIAPATETIQAQGKPVTVHGVSAKGLAHPLARFPELRRLMSGQEVQTDQLLAMGGDAVAAIIAAGCGYPGDHAAEIVAGSLSLVVQADLLAAVLRLTLPRGVGPFGGKRLQHYRIMAGGFEVRHDIHKAVGCTALGC